MEIVSAFGNWCSGPGFFQTGAHGGWQGWMPFHFGSIFQLIVVGLIIYFTVRLFRNRTATNSGPATPEQILKRRYAAGEIDEQTYRTMRDDFKNS